MKDVRINKHDLIGSVRANRKEHKQIFEEARIAYKKQVADLLAKLSRHMEPEAEWREWTGALKLLTALREPTAHLKEYDRALAMLEMEVSDTVTLSAQDFAQLVQDEWHWSLDWAISNSPYSSNPKLRQITAGDE